jgi:hypothetical protein
MTKVTFLIKSKNNPATIHVRFHNGVDNDISKSTRLFTNPNCWDKRNGMVRNTIEEPNQMLINSKLKGIEATIYNKYLVDYTSGEYIDSDWLESVINGYYNQNNSDKDYKIYFIDFANKWIEQCKGNRVNIKKGKVVTDGTIDEYNQAVEMVKNYDKHFKVRTKFVGMDLNWLSKWVNYMLNIRQFSSSTTYNKITIIKMIIREAKVEHNIKVNPHFESKKFTVARNLEDDPRKIYLDDEKLKILFDLEVPKRLLNSKDLLIIGCWTGLRVSDFMKNLNLDDMENGVMDLKNKKTSVWVKFPLHPMIKLIIKQNGGNLPKIMSEAAFGKHIKEICKLAGFNKKLNGIVRKVIGKDSITGKSVVRNVKGKYHFHELVTTHICRRSFSSNLSDKVSDEAIMDMAGWSTKKMKEHYNKKKKTASAFKVDDYYNEEYGYLLK